MSMLTKIKTDSETQRAEQKRLSDRKKHILIFIQRHLQDTGYLSAAAAVGKDTNLSLDSLNTADNMDLDVIFQEFESFYEMKFGKKPKLCSNVAGLGGAGAKKGYGYGILPAVGGGAGAAGGGSAGASGLDQQPHHGADIPAASVGGPSSKRRLSTRNAGPGSGLKPPQAPAVGGAVPGAKTSSGGPDADPTLGPTADSGDHGGGIEVVGQNAKSIAADGRAADNNFVDRVRKPLPLEYAYNSELRELATLVERDICVKNPNVRFDPDIVGLTRPKQLVKEAVILPMKYPTLFTGILSPWRGILLFGPPGTGKTMLAKAVATECQVTFFNVSASTIVSKWRGESEKLARVLFDLARHHAPSTIFIDELDSVMSARGGGDEHEGSRRLKTEILIQMDGLTAERENAPQVFLLAASNLPWDLDPAMLRRLEKRILVPLPCRDGRRALLETYLSGRVRWQKPNDAASPNTDTTYTNLLDVAALARRLDGWSGSDIRLLCKEIAMGPLRRCLTKLESGDLKSIAASNTGANGGGGLGEELVTPADVASALARVSPAPLTCDVEKYEEWNTAFGST